jgi:hypothetical protein
MNSIIFQSVPSSISLAIWGTAFIQGRETLERASDSISDSPRDVKSLLGTQSLALYLSELRNSGSKALRCHFPITGNMDCVVGIDEFVDIALDLGHVVTNVGSNSVGIYELGDYWNSVPRLKEPVKLKHGWQEIDKDLSVLLHEASDEIEAFDLVKDNQTAHDFLIDLEHDISIQHYPEDQPTRVTFLIGRLLRVLAITTFALENQIDTFSATKQSMWSLPIADLHRTCRQGLSSVTNYALEKIY